MANSNNKLNSSDSEMEKAPLNPTIAVILPAYNEELTIGKTLESFSKELPDAKLYVIDNNSSDRTSVISKEIINKHPGGGGVISETRQGKGNALKCAFHSIHADYYLISDADLTYPADQAATLLDEVKSGRADMAVGNRHANNAYARENKRNFHNFGNILVRKLVNKLYHTQLQDILSGYRAFSRQFIQNFPIMSEGFEIETEMTLYALDKKFRIIEKPVDYKDRPEGSSSKLNTFSDGFRVLNTIFRIMRYYRPLFFFSWSAFFFSLLGILVAIPVITDYFTYDYIYHMPSAILACGLETFALLLFIAGIILDSNHYYYMLTFELIQNNKSQRNVH